MKVGKNRAKTRQPATIEVGVNTEQGHGKGSCPSRLRKRAVVSRLAGAILRAVLMVVLVITPAITVPGTGADTAQIVALTALFAGAFTMFEYASTYPGLIEFRDAPPYNRIRFAALFATVLLLSLVAAGRSDPTTLTEFITAIGGLVGRTLDFPYSPVNLLKLALPEGASQAELDRICVAAGMSYLISLIALAVFLIALKLTGWPGRGRRFNVWVNLPTFDPTAGGDVVYRLERDATINVALGFLLPFLTPAIVKAASSLFGSVSLTNDHTLIWTVAAWAFLPASLFMRGIAMGRLAAIIRGERARNLEAGEAELSPA